jgi:hypothetical protein
MAETSSGPWRTVSCVSRARHICATSRAGDVSLRFEVSQNGGEQVIFYLQSCNLATVEERDCRIAGLDWLADALRNMRHKQSGG